MFLKDYETVFILNPVLSETQVKDAVDKFKKVLTDNGSEIVSEENWGLRKLAYPIQQKSTGFYILFEFKSEPKVINTLELEYRRDERIMRFLTTALDKHAVEYNARREAEHLTRKKNLKLKQQNDISKRTH
jgi:small subunit ribosomal protein S6